MPKEGKSKRKERFISCNFTQTIVKVQTDVLVQVGCIRVISISTLHFFALFSSQLGKLLHFKKFSQYPSVTIDYSDCMTNCNVYISKQPRTEAIPQPSWALHLNYLWGSLIYVDKNASRLD